MNFTPIFLLESVLPTVLSLLLIALVAILGMARWRRTILALAIIAQLLLIVGVLVLRIPMFGVGSLGAVSTFQFTQALAISTINCSGIMSGLAVILSLILTARAHQWTWFAILLVAEFISMMAVMFVPSFVGLYAFISFAQAQTVFTAPLYAIITTVLASLRMLAMILYALLAPYATTDAADSVTLP